MSEFRVKSLTLGLVQTNCYMVYDEETKRAAIIDPGDCADQIIAYCERLELKPEAVLLTHGHFDHMMAAEAVKEHFGLKIYACEKEVEVLADSTKNLMMDYYEENYTLAPDVTVKEGDKIEIAGFTWTVLETPGHTIGCCCYYIESEEVLFSGDTLFRDSYGRVDLPTGDAMAMFASVKRLVKEIPEKTIVYPGQSGVTTIEYEKTHNPLATYDPLRKSRY